ncbi:MAG TPA: VTT domain-containing protein [Candidatus Paceibacterota bacterium]|nr:VTT domain-containing protein [Candidatus Paceibacterota bacterium]
MEVYLNWLQSGIDFLGVWFIIPFLTLENIPVVGLFAPGLTVLVLSGFFHAALVNTVLWLYVIAWLTIFVADSTWYWLGYLLRDRSQWIKQLIDRAPDAETLITEQPWYALVGYQFIPYFRMFLPLAMGAYRYTPLLWLLLTAIGTALYVGVFLSIGVVGAAALQTIANIDTITTSLNRFLAIFALLYGVGLLLRYKKLKNTAT